MSDTITIKIDGREIECQRGEKVLQVALDNGIHIPHYCYHEGLTIAGNCRMCLCKASTERGPIPKPIITCDTDAVPGLEIDASSPETRKLQQAIMEFLLINHPLDCPVCDQAGECRLQDYAHEYGRAAGRFREAKRTKPDTVVGPGVALWKQRCIACSRCVRFCDEISGTGELRFVQRGDRVEIETFPGVPLDNPLSGNVVDICPVGALVSRDFLYEARVWNLDRTDSVCPGCSKGCNVHVDVLDTRWDEPVIKRLVPRENADVNQWWMCDYGRTEIHPVHTAKSPEGDDLMRLSATEQRVAVPAPDVSASDVSASDVSAQDGTDEDGGGDVVRRAASMEDALADLASAAERHRGAIAIIGSLWQTVEELHLLKQLATTLSAKVALLERPQGASQVLPGFTIPADKNPNRAGAAMVFGERDHAADLAAVIDGIEKGQIGAVIAFNSVPGYEPNAALVGALGKLKYAFAVSLFDDAFTAVASCILPGVSWAEKDGTYVNDGGRLQRLARTFDSPGSARADLEHLQDMLRALGGFEYEPNVSAAGVFKLAADGGGPLAGVSYPGRGSLGTQVEG